MAQHYQSRHACPDEKTPGSKAPLIVLLCLIGFCVVGAAVYALVHFVILAEPAAPTEPPTTATTAAPTLAPIPTEPPTEAPTEPDASAKAAEKLASMSDREKLCQLFIVTPEELTGVDGVTMAGETTKKAIADYPVGGIIYNTVNLETVDQTKELISKSQEYASTPMFIAVDEEGGDVARVASKLGTTAFDPMYTYKAQGAGTALSNAKTIGTDISALGFNLDFAPVADVWTNSENTVIGSRAYSDDYAEAAELVSSAVKGFGESGVLCTLKHFPGHGDTAEDSHQSLANVTDDEETIKTSALQPFKSGIEAGADFVMVGHLVVSALDSELPATLSSKVVPSLLREYLGYDGLVITDSMSMHAITDNYSYDEIIKGVFDADIDMILDPDDLEAYLTAIEKALDDGVITQEQIDAKVKKILTLKISKGLISDAPAATEASTDAATVNATEASADAPTETATVPETAAQ